MTYKPYLDVDEYTGDIPSAKLEKQLLQASRHIDVLTYNRIVGNFDKLTEFQKEIIKEVCKNLADWEYENSDMLNSVFKGYSINGVSVEFGGENIKRINDVLIPHDIYQTLCQTGLCCRTIGRYI